MAIGEWYYSPRPWLMGSGNLESLLASSLDLLRQLGIRVPDSGRHQRALVRLRMANAAVEGNASQDESTRRGLEHAHRTAWEAVIICLAAFRHRRRRGTPFTKERLQVLMDGPEEYSANPCRAWDFQFELFVAAQLVLGGLEASDGEPDLRFRYGYEEVGIAVKRLTSLSTNQVRRNVRKAAEQIQTSKLRGWFALNLDTTFREVPVHGEREELIPRFEAAFDSIKSITEEVSSQNDILGVLAYGHLSGWTFRADAKPELLIRAPFRWVHWRGDDPAGELLFKDFSDGWRPRVSRAIESIMRGDIMSVV